MTTTELAMPTKTKRFRVPASQLRAARDARGLSQEELADLLDVRSPTISDRENAKNGVAWEVWIATATVLGLPTNWRPGDVVDPEWQRHHPPKPS